jgi:hypothetical protein
VVKLTLATSNLMTIDSRRELGGLGFESAKMIVADRGDIDRHWTFVGKDRIGIITAATDGEAYKVLKKRFKFRTRPLSRGRFELIDPVSEALEAEIEAYLKSIPEFADYPGIYFFVQTNDSFERANSLDAPWGMIPVGNEDEPQMLVCDTGHGDGSYDVMGGFSGDKLTEVSITFIDDVESELA